jgi:hypothetical protein
MDALYQHPTAAPVGNPTQTLSNSMSKFQGTVLILLLCIGLALLGWYVFEVSGRFDDRLQAGIARIDAVNEKINASIQWEYRIESFPDRSFDQRISAMGKDGWELVFARRASDGADYSPTFSYEMIFKRPKKLDSGPSDKQTEKRVPKNK